MNLEALSVSLGSERAGFLVRIGRRGQEYGADRGMEPVTHRFIFDPAFLTYRGAQALSIGLTEPQCDSRGEAKCIGQDENLFGRVSLRNGALLPAFFQNLLPEGHARPALAAARDCAVDDYFNLLAACGRDLPGNVTVEPVTLSATEMQLIREIFPEAAEASFVAPPLEHVSSLCGVQPKLSVRQVGARYGRHAKKSDTNVIAKLPVPARPHLPELEHLSMRLARAAGVTTCETRLADIPQIEPGHECELDRSAGEQYFLAVERYDRSTGGRIHCEDFAQVLALMPEEKYGWRRGADSRITYFDVARVLMRFPSLGQDAVHELLRRLVVNEMLGNIDMHLKNIGLRYPDGVTPEMPPAYDIVGYAAYGRNRGHALMIVPPEILPTRPAAVESARPLQQALSPALVRAFCRALPIDETAAGGVISSCVKLACATWPGMIKHSGLPADMKGRLLEQFQAHPMVASLARRTAGPIGSLGHEVASSAAENAGHNAGFDVWGEVLPS